MAISRLATVAPDLVTAIGDCPAERQDAISVQIAEWVVAETGLVDPRITLAIEALRRGSAAIRSDECRRKQWPMSMTNGHGTLRT